MARRIKRSLNKDRQRTDTILTLLTKSLNSVKEKVNFLPSSAEHTSKCAHDPAHQNNDHHHKCDGDHRRKIRMPCGKPCKEDGEHVIPQTQCDIRKGFGVGSHGCANSNLATVCCQCYCS